MAARSPRRGEGAALQPDLAADSEPPLPAFGRWRTPQAQDNPLTGVDVVQAHALGGGNVDAVVPVHKGKAARDKEVLRAPVNVDHVDHARPELRKHGRGALLDAEAASAAGERHALHVHAVEKRTCGHSEVEAQLGGHVRDRLGLGEDPSGGGDGAAEHAVHLDAAQPGCRAGARAPKNPPAARGSADGLRDPGALLHAPEGSRE